MSARMAYGVARFAGAIDVLDTYRQPLARAQGAGTRKASGLGAGIGLNRRGRRGALLGPARFARRAELPIWQAGRKPTRILEEQTHGR